MGRRHCDRCRSCAPGGTPALSWFRGCPWWLGAKTIALAGAGILLIVSAVILFGPGGQPGQWRWAGFLIAVLVAQPWPAPTVTRPRGGYFWPRS